VRVLVALLSPLPLGAVTGVVAAMRRGRHAVGPYAGNGAVGGLLGGTAAAIVAQWMTPPPSVDLLGAPLLGALLGAALGVVVAVVAQLWAAVRRRRASAGEALKRATA